MKSLQNRIAARYAVDSSTGCWNWTGNLSGRGYPRIQVNGTPRGAHRISMELAGNPVPSGMVADHICRNRICINPDHLRAVTPLQNTLENSLAPTAINKRKTHCVNGHELTPDNIIWQRKTRRHCRKCMNIENARHKRKAAAIRSATLGGKA